MINPFEDVDWRPDRVAVRRFARSLVIGVPAIAATWVVIQRLSLGVWDVLPAASIAASGAGAGLVFWAVPSVARPFYVLWYGVACSIGLVVSNLLMLVIYYFVLTPIGVVRKVSGRYALDRHFDRSLPTYWKEAPPPAEPARYLRQF